MTKRWSIQAAMGWIGCGMGATVILAGVATYRFTGQWTAAVICLLSAGMLSGWAALFAWTVYQKTALFSEEICVQIDRMIMGTGDTRRLYDQDTFLDRILFRLDRLYQSMGTAEERSRVERSDLQALVSDVSHQVKTPATNLKLAASALLEREMPREEQVEYLKVLTSQVEKLDFLMSAMVKTSRLESGVIALVKKPADLFETLAEALGSVFPAAQEKQMHITVSCPETLSVPHDRKWTGEALFNILDNAVKYTPMGGTIAVSVNQWEAYTRIDISDNGPGIAESRQGAVFGRFYREPEVHEIDGLGIGLYLTREIIAKQGGYIQLSSQIGEGAAFSVFLPN